MQFSSANQKNHIFHRYQGHTRCHSKKHVALGTRMKNDILVICQNKHDVWRLLRTATNSNQEAGIKCEKHCEMLILKKHHAALKLCVQCLSAGISFRTHVLMCVFCQAFQALRGTEAECVTLTHATILWQRCVTFSLMSR